MSDTATIEAWLLQARIDAAGMARAVLRLHKAAGGCTDCLGRDACLTVSAARVVQMRHSPEDTT